RAVALGHFAESDRYVTEVTELAAMIDDPALPAALGLHALLRARLQRNDDEVRARLASIEDALHGLIETPAHAALLRATCKARLGDVEGTRAELARIGSRTTPMFGDLAPNAFLGEACALAGTEDERRAVRAYLRDARSTEVSGAILTYTYEGTVGRVLGL